MHSSHDAKVTSLSLPYPTLPYSSLVSIFVKVDIAFGLIYTGYVFSVFWSISDNQNGFLIIVILANLLIIGCLEKNVSPKTVLKR